MRKNSFGACSLSMARCWLPARERARQPEPRQHAGLEAGDGADPAAGKGEQVEGGRMADAGRAAQVGSERGLAAGSGRHEVEPQPPAGLAGAREALELPPTLSL